MFKTLATLFFFLSKQTTHAPDPKLPSRAMGSQVDLHGCVADGGYEWCESRQQCQRLWKTPCPTISTPMCRGSGVQLCRMMCPPPPHCKPDQCLNRIGVCCDFECVDTKPLRLGDICYQFCEDNSYPSVELKHKCPQNCDCLPPHQTVGFDNCGGDRAYRCVEKLKPNAASGH